MTSVSKNVYIDKLNDTVNKYNNTYHSTIKMKLADVKSDRYINSGKEINNKDPKFKIDDNATTSTYKTNFAKGYVPNWSEEVFKIKKLKTLCHGHILIVVLTEKKLLEHFTKKNYKKANQKEGWDN